MPYDEETAAALRRALTRLEFEPSEELSEKRMFGGLCVLLNGNMMAGVAGSLFVVRLDSQELEEAVTLPHVRPMDFTGRPMKNFAYVDPTGFFADEELLNWLQKSLTYVRGRQRVKVAHQARA
jgi:TfoX/Sxy family transcriptional regulator of competence genes